MNISIPITYIIGIILLRYFFAETKIRTSKRKKLINRLIN